MAEIEVVVPGVGNVTINNYRHQQPVECNAVPVDPATAYWFDELHESESGPYMAIRYYLISRDDYDHALGSYTYEQVEGLSEYLEGVNKELAKEEQIKMMPPEVYVVIMRDDLPVPEGYHGPITPADNARFIGIYRNHYGYPDTTVLSDAYMYRDAEAGSDAAGIGDALDVYYASNIVS